MSVGNLVGEKGVVIVSVGMSLVDENVDCRLESGIGEEFGDQSVHQRVCTECTVCRLGGLIGMEDDDL